MKTPKYRFFCKNCKDPIDESLLKDSYTDKRFLRHKCKKCKQLNLISKREIGDVKNQ